MKKVKKDKEVKEVQPESVPKKDLGGEQAPVSNDESVAIHKTEDEKNGKGSVVLGTIVNGVVNPTNNALPGKINPIEKKVVVNTNDKNKKRVTIVTPRERRMHTIMSIVVILALAFCGGSYYYFGVLHNPKNFIVKNITYNLGEKLSNNVNDYIDLNNVDELKYILNTSNVDINTIGTYSYTVTYQDVVKRGTINVVDTWGPVLTIKDDIMLKTNSTYKIEDFVSSCEDPSGCDYDFESNPDVSTDGVHTVNIIAKDALGNVTNLPVNYQVGSMLVSILCTSTTTTNESLGTRETIRDTVYFSIEDKSFDHISRRIDNIFMRQEGYQEFKNSNQSNSTYEFNDLNFSYSYVNEIPTSSNFINQDGAISYYEANGYRCETPLDNKNDISEGN